MISQMVLAPEPLAADVTREGPLVCVRALMDEEVVGLSKVAPTESANVLLFWPENQRKGKLKLGYFAVITRS